MAKRVYDWTGKKIGKLEITNKLDEQNKKGYYIYECICECGTKEHRSAQALSQAFKSKSNSKCRECVFKQRSERMKKVHEEKQKEVS